MNEDEKEAAILKRIEVEQGLLKQLDRIFPYLYDVGSFHLPGLIPAGLDIETGESFKYPAGSIAATLLTKYGYANITKEYTYNIELTDKGREAKRVGGHFAYESKIKQEEQEKKERQIIADKVTGYDFLTKKFIYRWRMLPYVISGLALIVSALAYFKPSKEQPATQPKTDTIQRPTKTIPLLKPDTSQQTKPK